MMISTAVKTKISAEDNKPTIIISRYTILIKSGTHNVGILMGFLYPKSESMHHKVQLRTTTIQHLDYSILFKDD